MKKNTGIKYNFVIDITYDFVIEYKGEVWNFRAKSRTHLNEVVSNYFKVQDPYFEVIEVSAVDF